MSFTKIDIFSTSTRAAALILHALPRDRARPPAIASAEVVNNNLAILNNFLLQNMFKNASHCLYRQFFKAVNETDSMRSDWMGWHIETMDNGIRPKHKDETEIIEIENRNRFYNMKQ